MSPNIASLVMREVVLLVVIGVVLALPAVDGQRVGGAVVAFATPGLNLLDGRTDLALLWDIRVRPEYRQQGVGSTLFRAMKERAHSRGCHDLTVETQNVNVPACRFYQRQGCVLRAVNHAVYRKFPEEIQLLWYKALRPSGHARTGTGTEG